MERSNMPERQNLRLGTLNYVVQLGRICSEPDLRFTPSGTATLSMRIAVDRSWKDKTTDEWKKESSFFHVQVWAKSAEYLSKKAHKGDTVLVEGELRSRTWETKEGEKKYVVEIQARKVQVLTLRPEGAEASAPSGGASSSEPFDQIPQDDLNDIPM